MNLYTPMDLVKLVKKHAYSDGWLAYQVEMAEPQQESGTMSDHEWLTVHMINGTLVGRVRGQYKHGGWSSWSYVYSPVEIIILPDQMEVRNDS